MCTLYLQCKGDFEVDTVYLPQTGGMTTYMCCVWKLVSTAFTIALKSCYYVAALTCPLYIYTLQVLTANECVIG